METFCAWRVLSVLSLAVAVHGYTETHCQDSKQAIVHLFEWSWDAVADECTKVLGPKGFCGVQVSPPMEHIQGGSWWTRYQPVSYKLDSSRSGNRQQFINMVNTCNSVGVMYVKYGACLGDSLSTAGSSLTP